MVELNLGWRGDNFYWTRNRPSRKKNFNMGKAFRRNQTFVIQIAISIALPPFGREALDGYIQLGARILVTQVLGTSDTQLLIRGCSL